MTVTFDVYRGSNDGTIVPGRTTRELRPNDAYIQLTHSGVCGTDEHYRRAGIVLGHEGIGTVKEIGSDVKAVKVGDRVGFGWAHKTCGRCENCRTGIDFYCVNKEEFGTHDQDVGSFATHAVWDADTLHKIPEGLDSAHAAPLMCGGATVWGPLAQYGARATDRVGIVGIGGLGHLAIQFAAKMGCEVVVFSSTESKRDEALKLGATEFHTLKADTAVDGIKKVNHLLICGSAQPDYSKMIALTAAAGKIYPMTISFDSSPVPMLPLTVNGITIQGTAEAPHIQIDKMLEFSLRHGIKPIIQTWPMTRDGVEEAMEALRAGKTRYRGVLVAQQ